MSTYYSDQQVTLYHGDCLEITEWLAADVMITDPPYGIAFQSGQRAETFDKIAGDSDPSIRDAALAAWRSCCDAPAAVFGTWRVPRPAGVQQMLVWHKRGAGPGMGDLSTAFGTNHEEIYLLGRWDRGSRVRRPSVITTRIVTIRIYHPDRSSNAETRWRHGDTCRSRANGRNCRPIRWGGGSTLVAARNLGRRAVGVEIEERYCEIAAKRLDQLAFDFGAMT